MQAHSLHHAVVILGGRIVQAGGVGSSPSSCNCIAVDAPEAGLLATGVQAGILPVFSGHRLCPTRLCPVSLTRPSAATRQCSNTTPQHAKTALGSPPSPGTINLVITALGVQTGMLPAASHSLPVPYTALSCEGLCRCRAAFTSSTQTDQLNSATQLTTPPPQDIHRASPSVHPA